MPCRYLVPNKPAPAPETAAFVLREQDVSEFGEKGWRPLSKRDRLRNSGASHSFRTNSGTKRFAKLEAFEKESFKLTVFAKDGDQYEVPLARRCGSGVFAAQKSWKGSRPQLPEFGIGYRDGQLLLANRHEDPSYVSVKWALLAGDLERGRYKRDESWRWNTSSRVATEVGPSSALGELVYLQFIQLNLDGTTLTWKGWAATNTRGVLRVGKGQPPKATQNIYSSATRCPSPVIHKVPPRPNFHDERAEVIEDESGAPLETAPSELGFVVEAKVGQRFRAEWAPRSVCPTWYEVEEGWRRPFSLPSQIQLSRYGDDKTYSLELSSSTMERKWPPLKLRWSATLKGLKDATASIPEEPGFSNHWPSFFVVPDSTSEFYVEIVPQWTDPKARVGVTARVRLDRSTDVWWAKFDQVTPIP